MNAISFRRMSLDDLPVFGKCLIRPHIREWWGDPDEERTAVRQMIEGQDTTEPYIFNVDGIADPDRLSKGIGSAVLAAFVQNIRQRGHDRIIIDPDTANKRAIRAYEKAGFRIIPDLLGKTGDSLLMQHQTTELPS
jgi:RimJ/RimL family protein N-acetyltransferase